MYTNIKQHNKKQAQVDADRAPPAAEYETVVKQAVSREAQLIADLQAAEQMKKALCEYLSNQT
jgi:hypothetical protein